MAAIHLLALLAVTSGAEEVHVQSSRRVQQGQIKRGGLVEGGQLRLDMGGDGRAGNSSEVMGRQGRASRGRQSRQSCTAKTGMSFTRYCVIKHHVTTEMGSFLNPCLIFSSDRSSYSVNVLL